MVSLEKGIVIYTSDIYKTLRFFRGREVSVHMLTARIPKNRYLQDISLKKKI